LFGRETLRYAESSNFSVFLVFFALTWQFFFYKNLLKHTEQIVLNSILISLVGRNCSQQNLPIFRFFLFFFALKWQFFIKTTKSELTIVLNYSNILFSLVGRRCILQNLPIFIFFLFFAYKWQLFFYQNPNFMFFLIYFNFCIVEMTTNQNIFYKMKGTLMFF